MLVLQILGLFVGYTLSTPVDEFRSFGNEGELLKDDAKYMMGIIPGGYIQQSYNEIQSLPEILSEGNESFKTFNKYIENGVTEKGLTFNIYDDQMREAAVALFRLLQNANDDDYKKIVSWASKRINKDMLTYAVHLNFLYSDKLNREDIIQTPCYVERPNYFVNSETLVKALKVRIALSLREDLPPESKAHHFYQSDRFIVMNTNYSGWNLQENGGKEELNYFREDIALNCYYYGVHLTHPFWMSNEELDEMSSRHAEHYYYAHQQLMARYLLEEEHLSSQSKLRARKVGEKGYNPSLMYDNGLPFPVRPPVRTAWSDERTKIKSIDIALRECISRKVIIMQNGTIINMTNVNLLSKLVRANLDGIKTSKIIRSLYGYGDNTYPVDQYNPAPSVLHHPETSLRDPLYWKMIQNVLNYFTEFKHTMTPFDMSEYETDEFTITDNNFTKIVTYFDYYQFPINNAISHNNYLTKRSPFLARQRRLHNLPFSLNFTVESKSENNVTVRLFLGPSCNKSCWLDFPKFYELDSFNYLLQNGTNIVSWTNEMSSKYCFYKDELRRDYASLHNKLSTQKNNKYNMFKFPGNLLIPRGSEEGLNFKLFVMLTETEDAALMDHIPINNYYRQVNNEIDLKPLGFPFHMPATDFKYDASNYRFYDVKVFHSHFPVDENDFFPANTY